jgi:D-alanine-D-alanine ligase
MPDSPTVVLLYGGRSGEHEVSLRSAASVAEGLAPRHRVAPVLIDRAGQWWLQDDGRVSPRGGTAVFMLPAPEEKGTLRRLSDARPVLRPDVVFPVLHGTFGEDGTVQGFLELAGAPYVGSGVAASATGMDKALMKALFTAAGLPQTPHVVLHAGQVADAAARVEPLGFPLFVKPANAGSSVGVSKVKTRDALGPALEEAFAYDGKAVVEAGVDAREIETAVLGNERPEVSLPGEIIPDREFYDYASKYSDSSKTELKIPAPLLPAQVEEVRSLAVRVFQAVDAAGYARVDFLMERRHGRFLVNEINTIPGFTSISMFPKMWEATGLAYADLLARLVELGLERHARRAALRTDYRPA